MAITIKDIARESGVNISTVSRSLNGNYGVHRNTRERVLAVAHRLNYRPNRVARGLATGRSNTFGLVVSDIRNPFFAEVARGAEDAAYAVGCDLVLCNSDMDANKQMRYMSSLLEKCVDGILMNSVAALDRSQQELLSESGIPVVLLNRTGEDRAFSSVSADNFQGGAIAGEYLAKLGHRSVAHLTGPKRHGTLSDRAGGFLKGLDGSNSGIAAVMIYSEQTMKGGYDMARELIRSHRDVTAIFAANDAIAFGVLRALLEAKVRIPDDISLIGFDNVALSEVVHPPLTTIHQPKYEIGQAAIEMLVKQSKPGVLKEIEHRVMDVELVQRESCRAA
jgi:LacI family transcriptional regulator